ncbi:PREDICTED: uncharacterized protein LOC105119898 [Populus euphratica]|uniref:Uncharacterized protein LOC105119898 n=1 Tax=Populus euphratica TaxID=75702 RepID=A0AAJ6TSR7_POPEU|nr:PREDICTED: uncharacterized protein LOC105119898 [Populus euphratica]
MAADVSSIVNSTRNSEILITKDLLGGFSKVANKDLDLDLQVTKTRDAPHDSKSSGKVYSQRCNSVSSPLPSRNSMKHHKERTTQESEVQDSKLPPLKFLEESCLELKLVPSNHCQSVCTLDKVKSALQRAEKETMTKKRSPPPPNPRTSDIKEDRNGTASSSTGVFAAACPGCLLYVITLKTNPKCPSCNSIVPSPSATKKPRIDLNASL